MIKLIQYADDLSDGNIRYFEYENDKFEYLSEYKSADPQRGLAFVPKRGVHLHENEIMRAYKTVADNWIEPVSFVVPRRAEVFQSDIYPPTTGLKPAVSGKEWFEGKSGIPPKVSLESVYEGKAPEEVPSEYKPAKIETPITSPPPTKTETPKAAPAPVQQRAPPPKIEDNKASIAAMANKFADKDDEEESSDDDASSFEEVAKPIERPATRVVEPKKEVPAPPSISAQPKAAPVAAVTEPPRPTPVQTSSSSSLWAKQNADSAAPATVIPSVASASTSSSAAAAVPNASPQGAAEGLKGNLTEMKEQNTRILQLLEQQSRVSGRLMDQIMFLTEEVEKLRGPKTSAGGGNKELEEKIRRLELELEEARSG
jgi:coronin-1B/1C/6